MFADAMHPCEGACTSTLTWRSSSLSTTGLCHRRPSCASSTSRTPTTACSTCTMRKSTHSAREITRRHARTFASAHPQYPLGAAHALLVRQFRMGNGDAVVAKDLAKVIRIDILLPQVVLPKSAYTSIRTRCTSCTPASSEAPRPGPRQCRSRRARQRSAPRCRRGCGTGAKSRASAVAKPRPP